MVRSLKIPPGLERPRYWRNSTRLACIPMMKLGIEGSDRVAEDSFSLSEMPGALLITLVSAKKEQRSAVSLGYQREKGPRHPGCSQDKLTRRKDRQHYGRS